MMDMINSSENLTPEDTMTSNHLEPKIPLQNKENLIVIGLIATGLIIIAAIVIFIMVSRAQRKTTLPVIQPNLAETTVEPSPSTPAVTTKTTTIPTRPVTTGPTIPPETYINPTLQVTIQTTDPNLKLYSSPQLRVAFSYLEKQDSQTITVKETDNSICLTYDAQDKSCAKGQFVQVFQKSPTETLAAAIKRQFLFGKDASRCIVITTDPTNYPDTYVKAEITYPNAKNMNMEKMSAETDYCSSAFAQTNGIRYFLEDKSHPNTYLFFNIGQYSILSEANKPWQETVVIE